MSDERGLRLEDAPQAAVTAPGGLCESCGQPLRWCFLGGLLHTVCDECYGLELAEGDHREGREAVMPDGRPVRGIELVVQDARLSAFHEGG